MFLFVVATASALSPAPVLSDRQLMSQVSEASCIEAGCAVTAPPREFSHFLRKATVFVLEHDDTATLGVNLMKPTMLTVGEATNLQSPLAGNTLYMGGEYGGRGAVMLHAVSDLEGAKPIGDSGIYVGGIKAAGDRISAGLNDPSEFKFFFNLVRWSAGELQRDVDDKRWSPFKIPKELVLKQDDEAEPSHLWNLVYRKRVVDKRSVDDDEEDEA